MNPSSARPEPKRSFVVATPARTVCDDNARVLEKRGLLRFLALGTRHGTAGIPPERTRLNPAIGLVAYAEARVFSMGRAESLRFRLHPWFDHWVKRQLEPGDHVISSYGYVNASFRWARQHGGRTFLDGGNSHPENFWTILEEEHRRWHCPDPPIARHHYERSLAMLPDVDYVLSPSSFVTKSFLARGFKPEQILKNVYPLDLHCFTPAGEPRPKDRPLTLISTGGLSLRKGSPYLLEAFRIVRKTHPHARLVLVQTVADNMQPLLPKFRDLSIDWIPRLSHPQLAEQLRRADVFVLPSLEDGFARTVAEALGCGLPVVTTPNTGASDLVQPGVNGEIVPIRDAPALAEAILKWAEIMLNRTESPARMIDPAILSFEEFEKVFLRQLEALGLAGGS